MWWVRVAERKKNTQLQVGVSDRCDALSLSFLVGNCDHPLSLLSSCGRSRSVRPYLSRNSKCDGSLSSKGRSAEEGHRKGRTARMNKRADILNQETDQVGKTGKSKFQLRSLKKWSVHCAIAIRNLTRKCSWCRLSTREICEHSHIVLDTREKGDHS